MRLKSSSFQSSFTLEIVGALYLLISARCAPVVHQPNSALESSDQLKASVAFLEKYGYLEHGPFEGLNSVQLMEAVREFQWISHLPLSGALDKQTVKQMGAPRCGVKDIGSHEQWAGRVEALFFGRAHAPRRVKRYSQQGGALAHAFFPRRGEAHFDNDERWSLNQGKGRNLFIVTAHEIGHTLGLEHSPVKNALMSPFYKKLGRNFILNWDDKMSIQKLYAWSVIFLLSLPGKPVHQPRVQLLADLLTSFQNPAEHADPGKSQGKHLQPSYCRTHFDTLTKDMKQNIYIFRGADYWKLSRDGSSRGPMSLQKSWPDLPAAIEAAAVSEKEGKFYFFRGGRCWRYMDNQLDQGYPMKVKKMGLPRHPDAAFYYPPLSHLVIFKGSKYFVLNEETMKVEQYYPRTLGDWRGIPVGINGVFTWNDKRTYFFKDEMFWKFDNSRLKVLGRGKWAEDLGWTGCRFRNQTDSVRTQT
ncbi:matrix metalloproteinase-28 isoform X6 [Narcine bancroftii]|uniref:matrix metalloproteinase-28 isoform X6 n=1 Tax=Narcine bancroftii TaxID=1343680 RepID=UPI003831B756